MRLEIGLKNKSVLLEEIAVFRIGGFVGIDKKSGMNVYFDFHHTEYGYEQESLDNKTFKDMFAILSDFDYEYALESNEGNEEFLAILDRVVSDETELAKYLSELELGEVYCENTVGHDEEMHREMDITGMAFYARDNVDSTVEYVVPNEELKEYNETIGMLAGIIVEADEINKEEDRLFVVIKRDTTDEMPTLSEIFDNVGYMQSNGYVYEGYSAHGHNEKEFVLNFVKRS